MNKIKVLFVCMGNICRSPTAEGAFRHLVNQKGLAHRFHIDSAGTHAYHVGNPPDQRSLYTARARGIDIASLRARQVDIEDFDQFDHILAMDKQNLDALKFIAPKRHNHKAKLFLSFAPELDILEVPDPYYGGEQGFEKVFDMIEAASRGFLESLGEMGQNHDQ